MFQCSSASRKFLNVETVYAEPDAGRVRFSALQRAENSSISLESGRAGGAMRVSVLFSEPKIPQWRVGRVRGDLGQRFSALQRAENSSIGMFAVMYS